MKLSSLTIIWIGIAAGLCFLMFAFFQYWQPNTAEAAAYLKHRDDLHAEVEKRQTLVKNREKAQKEADEVRVKWLGILAGRTPDSALPRGIDTTVNPYQLTVNTRKFKDEIQRAVNTQLMRGGVKILGTGPAIPEPDDAPGPLLASFYNYPAIPFPVLIFDLGTIRIQGTWNQIMDHVHAWRTMPHYMAVVNGLNIQGTSPALTASYQLSIIGYLREKSVHAVVPGEASASGSSSGGGGGATAGRPSGGVPGGPIGNGPPAPGGSNGPPERPNKPSIAPQAGG